MERSVNMTSFLLRGGRVIDGRGSEAFEADVLVRDGLIAEVGRSLSCAGAEVIDADGAFVTPGFIDLHCHYDGQVSWDEKLEPSSSHGVTTVIIGNCGVGFAPARPGDHARLIRLMEGVEDIPGSALAEGIDFQWESFPEFIEAIDRRHRTMDVGLQVPHDALRFYVMGERAEAQNAATPEDIAEMSSLLSAALRAGAVGFSTGRTENHRSADGKATPASEASRAELCGLASAFAKSDHGVLQVVSDFDLDAGRARFDGEFSLLIDMVEAAGGRPLSVSTMQRDADTDQWKRILSGIERGVDRGLPLFAQVAPRGVGLMLGLTATFHPFIGFPSYKALSHLPLAERVARLRLPELRDRLLAESSEPLAGDGSPVPPLADRLLSNLDFVAIRLFRLGEKPNYEPDPMQSLYAEAHGRGVSTLRAIYDALLEDDGESLLYFPIFNYGSMNLDTVKTMLEHPRALWSLSDGGAHVGTICDAGFSTYALSHWGRDRAQRFPLEHVVHMLTGRNADYQGLADRGRIVVGSRADLNVVDLDRLALEPPRLVNDLPAGGRRFLQGAAGYIATLVNGRLVARNDRLTGETPGRVLRM